MTLMDRWSLILSPLLDKPFQVKKEEFFSRYFWPWLPTVAACARPVRFCTPAWNEAVSWKARICGNSCIYTRREHFFLAVSSQQSSLQPCQPFVEEEWWLPVGSQADSPCCFQRPCGILLLPLGSRRVAGNTPVTDYCSWYVPEQVSLKVWGFMISMAFKLSSSSRLQKMCITRKARGEKLIVCFAVLQDGSSVLRSLREHLGLERSGSHICQNTSPSSGRPKQSGFHGPCHTPEFCTDGAHRQLVFWAL